MKMNKIISNKNGSNLGRRGFSSYSPNSYRVERDGVVVGSIELVSSYPLDRIRPAFVGSAPAWVLYDASGSEIFANQTLARVREIAKQI